VDSPARPAQQVAAAVREAMTARGFTQEQLSAATGIPQPTLSRRLSGLRKAFDVDELADVAAALGTTSADLLGAVAA
jgi:transcriptional regulator with XRE-family HTH domain